MHVKDSLAPCPETSQALKPSLENTHTHTLTSRNPTAMSSPATLLSVPSSNLPRCFAIEPKTHRPSRKGMSSRDDSPTAPITLHGVEEETVRKVNQVHRKPNGGHSLLHSQTDLPKLIAKVGCRGNCHTSLACLLCPTPPTRAE